MATMIAAGGTFVGPESDHEVHGDNLKGYQEGHIQEEVPSHGKAKSPIHPLTAEANERRGHRNVGDHFGEAFVDSPHDASPENEGDEEACRTAFWQGGAHLHIQGWLVSGLEVK